MPQTLHSGDLLPIQLHWRAYPDITTRYKVFVHITDTSGVPLAQADTEPLADLRPTNSWRAGETITDRVGLWLPPTLKPGRYRVVVGLYDPNDGARLPASSLDGTPYANDAVPLGELVVDGG